MTKQEGETLINDVADIKKALLGDKYNGGFKQRLELVEDRARATLIRVQKFNTIFYTVLGAVTVIGTVITIIKNWSAI